MTDEQRPAPASEPATDAEIAWTRHRCRIVTGIGSTRVQKIIARIDQQRETIAQLRAAVAPASDPKGGE